MIRRYKETFVKEISKKVGNKYPNPINNNTHQSNIRLKTFNSTNFGEFHPAKRFSTQEIPRNLNTSTTIKKKYSINCETPSFIQNKSLYLLTTVGDENEHLRTIQKKRSLRIQNSQYKSDIFSNINGKFDVIVSNPPYISRNEVIMDSVKKYEPNIALYADNEGLYFYEIIIKNAKKFLNDKFLIAFEIGWWQGNLIYDIAKSYFNDSVIKIEKDLTGRDRYLFIINE